MKPTTIHKDVCLIPVLTQWVKGSSVAVSCGVGCRCSLEPMWLWQMPAHIAQIQPLAWELPYAAGMVLKRKKKRTNRKIKIKK